MNFMTKLTVSALTIGFTVFAGVWSGFEEIDGRMNEKVKEGKVEVLTIIHNLREERNALLKAQDDKVTVQLIAINNEMVEVRKDVRSLLGIARRGQVFVEKKKETLYTIREIANEGKAL